MNKMAADGHASVICVQWSKPDDAAGPCALHMCLPGVCCCDGAHQIHRDGGIQYRRLYCFLRNLGRAEVRITCGMPVYHVSGFSHRPHMRIQYKQLKPIEVVCVAESFSGHSNYDLKPVEVFCELWPNLA